MRLADAPLVRGDLTQADRDEIAQWEPRDLTVRVYWSFSERFKGFAAIIRAPEPGGGTLAETYRHKTPIEAARAAHRHLQVRLGWEPDTDGTEHGHRIPERVA